jgi:chorismate mutase
MGLSKIFKEAYGLESLRDLIDKTDEEMVELLAKRTDVVIQIADFKRQNNIQTVQQGRWDEVLRMLKRHCDRHGLNFEDVKPVWDAIHHQSVNAQNMYKDKRQSA